MRTITRAALALSGAAALTLLAVVPANAVDVVTVAIAEGDIGLITLEGGATLTEAVPGEAIDGQVAGVEVTDDRAITGAWAVSVNATAFTNAIAPDDAASMSAAAITYTMGAVTATGAPVITNVTPDVVLTATNAPVANATVAGNNSAVWTADLSIAVPAGALAGTYSTTITHSVL